LLNRNGSCDRYGSIGAYLLTAVHQNAIQMAFPNEFHDPEI
jgi:hypothetical protein